MSLLQIDLDRTEHPVDIIERIAALNHRPFDRGEQVEISITVAGGWTQYTVAFTWLAEVEALHVACSFDLKIRETRRAELASLVSLINEELWNRAFRHLAQRWRCHVQARLIALGRRRAERPTMSIRSRKRRARMRALSPGTILVSKYLCFQ
jgi:hypothetical protein